MFAALENEINTQEIIENNAAAGRENITQRIVQTMKIFLIGNEFWQHAAEDFEGAYLHDSTETSRDDEK